MGLDITAYENVDLVRACKLDEWKRLGGDPEDGCAYLFNIDFPERSDGLPDGEYRTSGRELVFAAGSYGNYNVWRDHLSRRMRDMPAERLWSLEDLSGPFAELICFADNQGFIGPVTSAKLARDFVEHQGKADAFVADDAEDIAWFKRKYADWRKAFELAAGAGAVEFH